MIGTAIAVVIGLFLVVGFFVVSYVIARKQADKGTLENAEQWPAEKLPLRLILDRRGLGRHLGRIEMAFMRSVEWWNSESTMRLFDDEIIYWDSPIEELAKDGGTIEIKAGQDSPDDAFAGRAHIRAKNGLITSGWFEIDEDQLDRLDDEVLFLIVRHEKGHTLGLADDDDPKSIMYHSLEGADERILTKKDQDILLSAYYLKRKEA